MKAFIVKPRGRFRLCPRHLPCSFWQFGTVSLDQIFAAAPPLKR